MKKAMILAAGLGRRMRPLTLHLPKPLVKIAGQCLLDRAIAMLEDAGVEEIVVNVHHLADQIEQHLAQKTHPRIVISDERDVLLDSAGGVVKALPLLGSAPFYIVNADTFWVETHVNNLTAMAKNFQRETMDMLLLSVEQRYATGVEKGDFIRADDGYLTRAQPEDPQAVIYGGAMIVNPAVFSAARPIPHSLNQYFDQAIARKRLLGHAFQGWWYSVGQIDMIKKVEKLLHDRDQANATPS